MMRAVTSLTPHLQRTSEICAGLFLYLQLRQSYGSLCSMSCSSGRAVVHSSAACLAASRAPRRTRSLRDQSQLRGNGDKDCRQKPLCESWILRMQTPHTKLQKASERSRPPPSPSRSGRGSRGLAGGLRAACTLMTGSASSPRAMRKGGPRSALGPSCETSPRTSWVGTERSLTTETRLRAPAGLGPPSALSLWTPVESSLSGPGSHVQLTRAISRDAPLDVPWESRRRPVLSTAVKPLLGKGTELVVVDGERMWRWWPSR